METITSRQNRTVREAASLLSSGEERRQRGEFLCEGARLCQDAALSGVEILRCFVTAQALEKYAPYVKPVLAVSREAYQVADHVAGLLSSTKSSQGIFCQCRWPRGLLSGGGSVDSSCAVLENLQDPGNLGTILRTAEALGADGVILSRDCCDLFALKTLRAAMGSAFRVPVYRSENPKEDLLTLSRDFITCAAVVDQDACPVTQMKFGDSAVLVIGNEGNGLPKDIAGCCRVRVTIPMAGKAESLNAAMAAGILTWEMLRPPFLQP